MAKNDRAGVIARSKAKYGKAPSKAAVDATMRRYHGGTKPVATGTVKPGARQTGTVKPVRLAGAVAKNMGLRTMPAPMGNPVGPAAPPGMRQGGGLPIGPRPPLPQPPVPLAKLKGIPSRLPKPPKR